MLEGNRARESCKDIKVRPTLMTIGGLDCYYRSINV